MRAFYFSLFTLKSSKETRLAASHSIPHSLVGQSTDVAEMPSYSQVRLVRISLTRIKYNFELPFDVGEEDEKFVGIYAHLNC